MCVSVSAAFILLFFFLTSPLVEELLSQVRVFQQQVIIVGNYKLLAMSPAAYFTAI